MFVGSRLDWPLKRLNKIIDRINFPARSSASNGNNMELVALE